MSHPNPERDERVDRIRRLNQMRRDNRSTALAPEILDDIDYLISLLDSQADDKEFAKRTPIGIQIANDVATAMRDLCVAKVRESGAYWREVSRQFQRGDEELAFFTAKAKAADDIERQLQSLTLDQGEQEKSK